MSQYDTEKVSLEGFKLNKGSRRPILDIATGRVAGVVVSMGLVAGSGAVGGLAGAEGVGAGAVGAVVTEAGAPETGGVLDLANHLGVASRPLSSGLRGPLLMSSKSAGVCFLVAIFLRRSQAIASGPDTKSTR